MRHSCMHTTLATTRKDRLDARIPQTNWLPIAPAEAFRTAGRVCSWRRLLCCWRALLFSLRSTRSALGAGFGAMTMTGAAPALRFGWGLPRAASSLQFQCQPGSETTLLTRSFRPVLPRCWGGRPESWLRCAVDFYAIPRQALSDADPSEDIEVMVLDGVIVDDDVSATGVERQDEQCVAACADELEPGAFGERGATGWGYMVCCGRPVHRCCWSK